MKRIVIQGSGEITVPDENGIPTTKEVSLTVRVETSGGQIVSSGRLRPPKNTERPSDDLGVAPESTFSKAHEPLSPGRSVRHLA
jgi:hypothetical protein